MFQSFITRQLLKSKMKDIPEADQEKFLKILEKNPDFFMKIAKEVQEKTKQGLAQEQAMLSVMQTHKDELQKILS